jgi:hypothetical protein
MNSTENYIFMHGCIQLEMSKERFQKRIRKVNTVIEQKKRECIVIGLCEYSKEIFAVEEVF